MWPIFLLWSYHAKPQNNTMNSPISPIAIILLNEKGLETARRIQQTHQEAIIWGLEGRVSGADKTFQDTGAHIRELFETGTTVIGLMATGILIRTLAPCLNNKRQEPPVLAVSDDGALIVPLLGGLTGANELARSLARKLEGIPAITASGARHYALQLEAPPEQYHLANKQEAKRITSDILNGATVQLDGHCTWLEDSQLPIKNDGDIKLRISTFAEPPPRNGLLYHPKSLLVEIEDPQTQVEDIKAVFEETGLALPAIAAIITSATGPVQTAKQCAKSLGVALRIVDNYTDLNIIRRVRMQTPKKIAVIELKTPPKLAFLGRSTGQLSVIGLGPGKESWCTGQVHDVLQQADVLVGYQTYIDMVPTRFDQQRIASDNRVETDRAREALDLAAKGHHVAVVSSGDPGIFAMASAVIEVLEQDPLRWQHIDFEVLPGLSAMQGAASLVGAPLGHDFAVISLSDIRKPFDIIKQRLTAAARSDMVIAIYNPASKTRREQIGLMQEVLLEEKQAQTPVLLAKNVGREGEALTFTTLGELPLEEIDMRTLLIIGSSKTRLIEGPNNKPLMYTPRTYDLKEPQA